MDEGHIEEAKELRDCAIAKFPVVDFGKGSAGNKIKELYEDVKVLVFCPEPWKLLGTHVRSTLISYIC